MSSSWTRGCPCNNCNFKNKNSYPLVNYIQNCDFERPRYTNKKIKVVAMTYDEKLQLSAEIKEFPGDKLSKVVQIIRRHEPALCSLNSDEIEIDFQTLKSSTLRALESFVALSRRKGSAGKRFS